MADKVQDRGFLQRWSERKHAVREGEQPEASRDADALPNLEETDAVAPEIQAPADLPDLEDLDENSDYSAFLGDGIPQDIAKMALRKLWRSDPVLANLDGLNDYDSDFSKVGMVGEVVKTVYRVGKGYLDGEEAEAESPAEEVPNEALPDSRDQSDELADGSVEQADGADRADEMDDTAAAQDSPADVRTES